jgi:uncharacterized protein YceK
MQYSHLLPHTEEQADLIWESKMEINMKNLILSFFLVLTLSGCGTIAQVWETGVDVVSNTVDTVVGGASDLVTAVGTDIVDTGAFVVDTGAGVVEVISDKVDKETDKLDGAEGN